MATLKLDPIALARCLHAEQISHTAFILMLALSESRKREIPLVSLCIATGMSYHATRNQLMRQPWFQIDRAAQPLITVSLSPEGLDKIRRLAARLARDGTAEIARAS